MMERLVGANVVVLLLVNGDQHVFHCVSRLHVFLRELIVLSVCLVHTCDCVLDSIGLDVAWVNDCDSDAELLEFWSD